MEQEDQKCITELNVENNKTVVRFNIIAFIAMVFSSTYMSYQLDSVGVPLELVLLLCGGYVFLFPWKPFTVINPETGEDTDATN